MLITTMATLTAVVILTAIWRMRASAVRSLARPTGGYHAPAKFGMHLLHARAQDTAPTATNTAEAKMPSVSVIVPALNEEESIDWVVENIPSWVTEVVLVDGLSVDGTELVVRDRRTDVIIVHQRSRGKGAALRAGFAAATGEIIVMIDADGSIDPREMHLYVEALVGGAEFVKGSRNLPGGGSVDFTLLRHLGNLGFVWAANLLFGVRFTDLCYGYCAFWRRDLDRLALTADGFEIEMELVLSAVKGGLRISEVPSMELLRRAGDSNLNAWKDGKRVLKTLVRQRLRRIDPIRARQAQIELAPVMRAAHSTSHWVPAGADRRRPLTADRRHRKCTGEGIWGGQERRLLQRRAVPPAVSEVLVARVGSDRPASAAPVGLRAGLVSRSA